MAANLTTDAVMLSQKADEVSDLLKLLAHPLRMRLLCQLAQGESSVGELIESCQAPQPTISQVLAKMKSEGLVTARREGRFIYYQIEDPRIGKLMRSLKRIFCDEQEA